MARRGRGLVAVLAAAVLLVPLAAGAAGGETRNRALERVLEGGMYSGDEGGQIARAFQAAIKAGVREREALALVSACVAGEFDLGQTLRVLSLAGQVAIDDLPVDAFVAKVEEGVAKRMPADRIVQAAGTRAVTLAKAKAITKAAVLEGFSRSDAEDLLSDVAAALEAGRSAEEIRAIFAAALEAGDGVGAIRSRLFP